MYLVGNKLTIADIILGQGIHFAYLFYVSEEYKTYPNIEKWLRNLRKNSIYNEFTCDTLREYIFV